jgi:hypothetical protein
MDAVGPLEPIPVGQGALEASQDLRPASQAQGPGDRSTAEEIPRSISDATREMFNGFARLYESISQDVAGDQDASTVLTQFFTQR